MSSFSAAVSRQVVVPPRPAWGACRGSTRNNIRHRVGVIPCLRAVALDHEFSSSSTSGRGTRREHPEAVVGEGKDEEEEDGERTLAVANARAGVDPRYDDDSPPPQEWHSRGFVNEGRVYSETFPVRFDEVGPDKKTTMRTVASMIQECSCNHVQSMWGRARFQPRAMREANLAFVCTRLHIEMREYPKWGDQVEVKTWLDVPGRATARRDWELVLCDGPEGECKALGAATSRWVAFNVEKRKMARIPDAVVEQVTRCALPNCHAVNAGGNEAGRRLNDIRAAPGLSRAVKHSARRSDLDMNGHVNNVVFTEWILEAVPQRMFHDFDLTELEIEFLSECNYGEEVDAVCCREVMGEGLVVEEDEVRMAHMLLKHGVDGKEAETVRARSVWKRKGFLRAEDKEMAKIIRHAWQRNKPLKEAATATKKSKGDGGDSVAALSR